MNIMFPIISFPYASRILMPEGIGIVNFANAIIDYFLLIAGIGVNYYGSREAARFRDDKEELNKFSREMLAINIIAMLFAYLLFFISLFVIPRFFAFRLILCVIASKILFQSIGLEWLFNAKEEYHYITIRSAVMQLVCLVFLFVFVKSPEDYVHYAMLGVISSAGANIFNLFYARKFINPFKPYKLELRKHIKKLFLFFGVNFATKIYAIIDTTMLGFLAGYAAVGFYTAANKMVSMVVGLLTSVLFTFLPRSTYYIENKLQEKYRDLIIKASNVALFFALPAATGVFLLGRQIILLFSGKDYLPGLPAIRVLCPQIILFALCAILENVILTPQKKERFVFYAQIVACITNFILNYIFIRYLQATGAAIATFFSELAVFIVLFSAGKAWLRHKEIAISLLQSCAGTAVMAGAVLVSLHFLLPVTDSPFWQLLPSVLAGMISYAACMLVMKNSTALMIIHRKEKQ